MDSLGTKRMVRLDYGRKRGTGERNVHDCIGKGNLRSLTGRENGHGDQLVRHVGPGESGGGLHEGGIRGWKSWHSSKRQS